MARPRAGEGGSGLQLASLAPDPLSVILGLAEARDRARLGMVCTALRDAFRGAALWGPGLYLAVRAERCESAAGYFAARGEATVQLSVCLRRELPAPSPPRLAEGPCLGPLLGSFPRLQQLALHFMATEDVQVLCVAARELPHLTALTLNAPVVGEMAPRPADSLAALSRLTRLRSLELHLPFSAYEGDLNDSLLQSVVQLTQLSQLCLSPCIDREWLGVACLWWPSSLGRLQQLQSFDDSAGAHLPLELSGITTLTQLSLAPLHWDNQVESLCALRHLACLEVGQAGEYAGDHCRFEAPFEALEPMLSSLTRLDFGLGDTDPPWGAPAAPAVLPRLEVLAMRDRLPLLEAGRLAWPPQCRLRELLLQPGYFPSGAAGAGDRPAPVVELAAFTRLTTLTSLVVDGFVSRGMAPLQLPPAPAFARLRKLRLTAVGLRGVPTEVRHMGQLQALVLDRNRALEVTGEGWATLSLLVRGTSLTHLNLCKANARLCPASAWEPASLAYLARLEAERPCLQGRGEARCRTCGGIFRWRARAPPA